MSQEKVERYKKEKANRKQIMRKEKIQNTVRKCIVSVIGILLVCWIGYSAYDIYDSNKPVPSVQIDYQSFNEFSQDITEAQAQAAKEAEQAAAETKE
ncbi:MAG: hypothetical protein K1W34_08890 [Lachnospiraceae bacterium]